MGVYISLCVLVCVCIFEWVFQRLNVCVCVFIGTSFTLRATRVVRRLLYIFFFIFQMYFSASFIFFLSADFDF